LRNRIVEQHAVTPEAIAMKAMGYIFQSERRFRAAQRLARTAESPLTRKDGSGERWIHWLPGLLGGWTQVRDLRAIPKQSFRAWWEQRSSRKDFKGPDDAR
jgi:L-lactate dehydrogenase complex protein LldF